jgi:Copper type II ascorbate-dependent monooxygenase, C-terminal domain
MLTLRATPFVSLLAVAACHSAGAGAGAGAGGPVATLRASIGPWPVAPGEEETRCIVYRLGNPEGGYVRAIHADLGAHSHHMSLYRSAGTVERLTPFDCRGFDSVLEGDEPLFIAQERHADLDFPSDEHGVPVGFAIGPRQMMRLELHYLNTTATPSTSAGTFTLTTVPLETAMTPADIGFWGTLDIHIPPHSAWKTTTKFVQAPEGIRIFALTTHQHHLGTRMRVWYADDASDTARPPIADCRTWSDPPIDLYEPPLLFGQGGKAGLAYQCEWLNPGADPVTYGEGFNDEMCFLWHYYFPGRGFDHVVEP